MRMTFYSYLKCTNRNFLKHINDVTMIYHQVYV
ncbi:unnamed protein product [Schistosoma curassoni]|uniref:Uncharacterized protein n=1 Tax=Schistosoma curassoni TaxID=6186 RepID=A0A183KGW0_9TREM|nr:unnamed protein product [Schistosoma curassoni]